MSYCPCLFFTLEVIKVLVLSCNYVVVKGMFYNNSTWCVSTSK